MDGDGLLMVGDRPVVRIGLPVELGYELGIVGRQIANVHPAHERDLLALLGSLSTLFNDFRALVDHRPRRGIQHRPDDPADRNRDGHEEARVLELQAGIEQIVADAALVRAARAGGSRCAHGHRCPHLKFCAKSSAALAATVPMS